MERRIKKLPLGMLMLALCSGMQAAEQNGAGSSSIVQKKSQSSALLFSRNDVSKRLQDATDQLSQGDVSGAQREYKKIAHYKQALPADRAKAQLGLGLVCCFGGDMVQRNYADARNHLISVMHNKHADAADRARACLYVGRIYCYGDEKVMSNYADAYEHLIQVMNNEDALPADRANACFYLGRIYYFGDDRVKYDDAIAHGYFEKVANDAEASPVDRDQALDFIAKIDAGDQFAEISSGGDEPAPIDFGCRKRSERSGDDDADELSSNKEQRTTDALLQPAGSSVYGNSMSSLSASDTDWETETDWDTETDSDTETDWETELESFSFNVR